jgi:thiol-disulfide isomerase/thioredoxin
MKNHTFLGIIVVLCVIIIGAVAWLRTVPTTPGIYDQFAQCLGEKGVKFYGAFWCPHCQEQKAKFGKSAKKLPYVECSQPSGEGQLQVCIDEKITGYPTWVFADGSREAKVLELSDLSEKTSCPLPETK